MPDRSMMVDMPFAVSGSICHECGQESGTGSVHIKARFSKERLVLCPPCWEELKAQINKLIETNYSGKLYKKRVGLSG